MRLWQAKAEECEPDLLTKHHISATTTDTTRELRQASVTMTGGFHV